MQTHIVLYKAYPGNPQATDMIISNARGLLSCIMPISTFRVGRVIDMGRAVGGNQYDVVLEIGFSSSENYGDYMVNPRHLMFVSFVLRGWILKGSQAEDPEAEFMEYILHGQTPREWERNLAIPDSKVVWGGELVIDAIV